MSAKPTTQTDKLRAISNLQSEVTRRARSLRAEYARAAQGLRSRLEMRIYRIPKNMRHANMGELLQKYIAMQEEIEVKSAKQKSLLKDVTRSAPSNAPLRASPEKSAVVAKKVNTTGTKPTRAPAAKPSEPKPVRVTNPAQTRGIKRSSDVVVAGDGATDKENEAIENVKKRTKPAAGPPSRSVRDPSTILSPKSNNSRTLPQSPIRPPFGVPAKGFGSRPASPLKPPAGPPSPVRQATVTRPATATSIVRNTATRGTKATTASTRAAMTRGAAAPKTGNRSVSNSSNGSTATAGTTIVRRGATNKKAGTAATTAKKTTTATAGTAASVRRTAAIRAKTGPPVAETGIRRVLRKRA